ncbi:MAG: hypothetical protein D8M58_14565 [Calditrichaeota bacterium]|nr:MAG: hypothetical protein DWQ03_15805 [Calditrichota bacterium]MBL1206625.1 hypothetical protein [Calditrichota bacterium]NOG46452.1 hypothetical protein [Calditrichota bacterium]
MSSGYEKKDVSVKGLILGTIGLVLLIIVMVVFVRDYFVYNMENAITESAVNNPAKDLMEIQKAENQLLTRFKVIDKEKGMYQIPIDLAMKLVVQDYNK